MSDPSEPAARTTIEDATCLACGCLCDDIAVEVESGRIVAARNACPAGLGWFLGDHAPGDAPDATIAGRPSGRDEAVARAAEILAGARSPVVLGLSRTSSEAVASALAIADRIGAAVDPGPAGAADGRVLAFQRVGRVSATLGEVRNRADVVLFWAADPVATHPRHLERYSADPVGRFVPDGRAGRTLIVADVAWNQTADRADLFVPIRDGAHFETLWTLRALVRGVRLDPDRVARATGLESETLADLADRLRAARYGAMFLGEGISGAAEVEAALTLVRDLNSFTRFVILPMGAPGNASGAEAVLTWQSGYPSSVCWGPGFPESLPGVTSAGSRLARGEADAALIVGDADDARASLANIPRVVIGPGATRRDPGAAVALASATTGIDAGGTVTRVDGVALPLRPALAPRLQDERRWLEMIGGLIP